MSERHTCPYCYGEAGQRRYCLTCRRRLAKPVRLPVGWYRLSVALRLVALPVLLHGGLVTVIGTVCYPDYPLSGPTFQETGADLLIIGLTLALAAWALGRWSRDTQIGYRRVRLG